VEPDPLVEAELESLKARLGHPPEQAVAEESREEA
jgi:hypothetical protein